MTYLRTPTESPLYGAEVPNYLRVFALRPEVYVAWQQLLSAVRSGLDERRYALVTLMAARTLGSEYCSLAYTKLLSEKFFDDQALGAILTDHHCAGLQPAEVALMDFAVTVASDPNLVSEEDIDQLHQNGLSDMDIFQVIIAVCVRRFFSGVLSAVDAAPDAVLDQLDPQFRAVLTTNTRRMR